MKKTKIKICGIIEPRHAIVAAEAGADFIGMVFAESPRRVTIGQARQIVSAVRELPGTAPRMVGVFANSPREEIEATAEALDLDFIQLSGDEPEEMLEALRLPLIRAIHMRLDQPAPVALLSARRAVATLQALDVLPLLDTRAQGLLGGTGQRFDHSVAEELARETDFLLAGGLDPDNVHEVIARVQPWGVDVSSGVETNGSKDGAKIRAFVQMVRRAGERP